MITELDQNTALVLIDLQKGILSQPTAHPLDGILDHANQLIEAFRAADLPVVLVRVNPSGATWTTTRKEGVPQQASAITKLPSEFVEFTDRIQPVPEDILIIKKTWNAFYKTPLHNALHNRNITGIVLGGTSTSIGVEGTARAASELGYNISFVIDATTDSNPKGHEHSVQNIFPRLGEVGNTADIIEQLRKR